MRKFISLMLSAGMLLSLAACGGASASNGSEAETIKIGGLAPLTGNNSQYGIAVNNGAKLALEKINAEGGINGKQIEYICLDEKGDPAEALNAYKRLVDNEEVLAILGDVTSGPSVAVAQKAADDNMPMLSPTGTSLDITTQGTSVFRACFTDPQQGERMAQYASEKLGAKTAAILYDSGSDYSRGTAQAFESEAIDLGLEITASEGYQTDASDFNAQLTKIKQNEPDVIMAPCYYNDAAKIIVQAKNLGIGSTFIGSDGWDGTLEQVDASNVSKLNDSYYCSQYDPNSEDAEMKSFSEEYKKQYPDTALNMFSVLGYDGMYILADAIKNAKSTDSNAIIDSLRETDYNGLSGNTKFNAERNPVRAAYITKFTDGATTVTDIYPGQSEE